MQAKVTIVVPIYNVEKYVSKCLDSLIKQTFKDIEIWAVDDGSPDNSKQIVKQYVIKDSRVKLITKKNGGYGSVLKYAVTNVKTPYFLVCDPDDWLEEKAIEKLYNFAIDNDLDMVIGDKYNVYPELHKKEYVSSYDKKLGIEPKKIYTNKKSIQKFLFGAVSPHAKLFKTKITKNIDFPFKVSYTDFVLYTIALSKCRRIAYLNEPLAYYLIERPGNTKTDIRPSIVEDYLKGWDAVYTQLVHENKDSTMFMYCLYRQLLYMLSEYARVNKDANYNKELKIRFVRLLPYKSNLKKLINSPKQKILYEGLMNKHTNNLFINLYCKTRK